MMIMIMIMIMMVDDGGGGGDDDDIFSKLGKVQVRVFISAVPVLPPRRFDAKFNRCFESFVKCILYEFHMNKKWLIVVKLKLIL